MNKSELSRYQLYINRLTKQLEDYKEQLDFLTDSNPETNEELQSISSLEDSIQKVKHELDFASVEYRYLSDKTIVHDIDDLRNLFFGIYKSKYSQDKISIMWKDFVNDYRSNDDMLSKLTNNFRNDKKTDVTKKIKVILGDK